MDLRAPNEFTLHVQMRRNHGRVRLDVGPTVTTDSRGASAVNGIALQVVLAGVAQVESRLQAGLADQDGLPGASALVLLADEPCRPVAIRAAVARLPQLDLALAGDAGAPVEALLLNLARIPGFLRELQALPVDCNVTCGTLTPAVEVAVAICNTDNGLDPVCR